MVAVHEAVLKILDQASIPFISYEAVVTALAAAAGAKDRTEAEKEHLHALCAAMLVIRRPDGTVMSCYHPENAGARPAEQQHPGVHAVWSEYADAASHPAVRAQLHDLLWAARYGHRPLTHLPAAITDYRNAIPVLLAATGQEAITSRWKAVVMLRTAYHLAASYNQPQLQDVVTEMLDLADTALTWAEPEPAVVHALTEPLLSGKKNHPRLRPLLQRAVDHCRDVSLAQVEFLKDLRRTEPDPDAQRRIDERIVTALINHAEKLEGLAKLVRLEEAGAFARDRGLTGSLDRVLRIQQKLPPDDLGMTSITTEVNVRTDFISVGRADIDAADDLDQALRIIAATPPVFAEPLDAQQHGLIRLPSVRLNLNGPVVTNTSDEDAPAGQSVIDARVFSLDFHGLRIEAQLDQVKERFAPTTDQLLTLLTEPPLAPGARMRGLARALHAFWEGDDEVAIALVLPRLEGLLRRRLQAADVAVIRHAKGDTPGQVTQLGALISGMEEGGYAEPWPTAFRAMFGGPADGMNLRNGILHDLMDTPSRPRIALALQAALTVLLLPSTDPAAPQ